MTRSFLCLHISLALAFFASGCGSLSGGFSKIDRRVEQMIALASADLGPDAEPARIVLDPAKEAPPRPRDPYRERPPTFNPTARELPFEPRREAEEITSRLNRSALGEGDDAPEPVHLNLPGALAYATRHGREHRFEQEEYVLAALRLLIERHLWGPRFFNETTAVVSGIGDDGFFDTAFDIVNEFRVTQRLPYGGELAVRALAFASADLHSRVQEGTTQAAELIFSANVPLLRGAGDIAREDRLQAERELIYAAREYEQFRRQFLVDIARQFLDLVVLAQAIENAERSVESFEWLERRAAAFVETGRETPIDLALAQQSTLFARDRLNRQIESYRLAIERFKVRIGMPSDQPLEIVRSDLGLPVPEVTLEEAVERALAYRLDLQTARDQVDDARRSLANARNALLPDLNLFGTGAIPTAPGRRRGGLDFRPGDGFFEAGVTFGLPLDREIERINVRRAQITLERFVREYERFRDLLAVDTREAVRGIDRALFSLRIQEENVRIAERGQEAILADPDRATARDRTEAVDRLLRAQDELDAARRDLQVTIMEYLLLSGQLRVAPDGTILPLHGMNLAGQ